MKIILVNGSPKPNGSTAAALKVVADGLNKEGIQTEIFNIGAKVLGCTACQSCIKTKSGRCAIDSDSVNKFLEIAKDADGFVFGSPVYFASGSGGINSFMDRAFYVGRNTVMPNKPAATLVCCRRAGGSAALDNLNKYITISGMLLVTSRYWNIIHGNSPEEIVQDQEGMWILGELSKNLAWLLKSIKQAGLAPPVPEKPIRTNFIRG